MKFIISFTILFLTTTLFAQNNIEIGKKLQDISVTIHAGNSQGSGFIKTRGNTNYVWTAAHVVSGLRETRKVIDSKTGAEKIVTEFRDAQIVKELIEDGRSVGKIYMDAQVIRYSDIEKGEDLALLKVRKKSFVTDSVVFYLEEKLVPAGTNLYHCGSLLGQVGSNSITRGVMSQVGRVIDNKIFDQTTCAAFPGSSGGGIYNDEGKLVGMIVRGAGETFNLCVPVRRIKDWAKRTNVLYAIDDTIEVPKVDENPVEEFGAKFAGMGGGKKLDIPLLIRTINKE